MEKQVASLKEDLLKSIWFMRGSISYSEILQMTLSDREAIGKLVKENLETTKKSGLPFF